jgi:hypothetical protein
VGPTDGLFIVAKGKISVLTENRAQVLPSVDDSVYKIRSVSVLSHKYHESVHAARVGDRISGMGWINELRESDNR